ncbi:hypothetical protein FOCC_FOCC006929 [Frankliniella occidentalis]|nr:hypothetical protein FOCC_FOCC006929 [Frankliniella occidentalis]
MVFRCRGRPDELSGTTGTTGPTFNAGEVGRGTTTKFSHLRAESQQQYNIPQPHLLPISTTATATASVTASSGNAPPPPPQKAEDEFKRLRGQLESLLERCLRGGEARLADLLGAMLEDQPPPVAKVSVASQADQDAAGQDAAGREAAGRVVDQAADRVGLHQQDVGGAAPGGRADHQGNHVAARQTDHKHNGDHGEQRERSRERRERDRDRDRDRGVILRPTLLTVRELRVIQKGCIVQQQPRLRAFSNKTSEQLVDNGRALDNAPQPMSPVSPVSPLNSPLSQLNSPISQLNSPLSQLNNSGQLNSPQPDNDNGNLHTLKDSNHNDKPVDGPVATLTMVTDEVTV